MRFDSLAVKSDRYWRSSKPARRVFAWLPITIGRETIWLEFVEKYKPSGAYAWQYRTIEK